MVTPETLTDEMIREVLGDALDGGRRTIARIAQVALGTWHGCHEFVAPTSGAFDARYCAAVLDDGHSECARLRSDDTIHIAAARQFVADARSKETP